MVQNYVADYSHHGAARSLGDWLVAEQVPAISGIDTRTLTRKLREHGTMRGWVFPAEMSLEQARAKAAGVEMQHEVFMFVAPTAPTRYPGGQQQVLLIDVGAKDNIVRSLLARGVSVLRAPWHADLHALALESDGIMIGNGPGDPKDLGPLVATLRALLCLLYTSPSPRDRTRSRMPSSA